MEKVNRTLSKLVIVGDGAAAREVHTVASRANWEVACFLSPISKEIHVLHDLPVYGLERMKDYKDCSFTVAIGDPRWRMETVEILEDSGVSFAQVVDPSVVKGIGTTLGNGVIVHPNVVFTCDAEVGDFVYVGSTSQIGHETKVGQYSLIGPLSFIWNARIGVGVRIGAGVTVMSGHSIGDWATVGPGTVVAKDIPAHSRFVGTTGRVLERKRENTHDH